MHNHHTGEIIVILLNLEHLCRYINPFITAKAVCCCVEMYTYSFFHLLLHYAVIICSTISVIGLSLQQREHQKLYLPLLLI